MPWTSDDDEGHTHKATTRALKEIWAKVANECLQRTGAEGRADPGSERRGRTADRRRLTGQGYASVTPTPLNPNTTSLSRSRSPAQHAHKMSNRALPTKARGERISMPTARCCARTWLS